MSIASQVSALATRIGVEIKSVRTAIAAKADDSAVVHNTGTETVAGAKTFSTAPNVPVGSLLTNPVRRDDTRLSDARTPTAHASTHATGGGDAVTPASIGAEQTSNKGASNGYCGLTSGMVPAANLPNVIAPPSTLTYSTSVTPNAATSNNFYLPATGSFTLNPPTNPASGQMLMVEVKSTAAVTATVASGILLTGSLTATLSVPSGKTGFIGLRYSSNAATWFLLATSVQA